MTQVSACRKAEHAKRTLDASRAPSVSNHSSIASDAASASTYGTSHREATTIADEYGTRYFMPEGSEFPPFVLLLHGLGSSGEQLLEQLQVSGLAREKRFAFSAPNGEVDDQGRRFWNAGSTCCNFSHRNVDDVARLGAVLRFAIDRLRVDLRRIFVIGYSNGGFMAHRLACENSRIVKAIVSIAASGPGLRNRCNPDHPVAVLEIHGADDPIVPFDGGHLFGQPSFPESESVTLGLEPWMQSNGCRGALRPVQSLELFPELPPNETEIWQAECAHRPVQLWKVKAGKHVLALRAAAQQHIWAFIEAGSTDTGAAPSGR
jgi:polyhydroxybutyrate depolymerase